MDKFFKKVLPRAIAVLILGALFALLEQVIFTFVHNRSYEIICGVLAIVLFTNLLIKLVVSLITHEKIALQ